MPLPSVSLQQLYLIVVDVVLSRTEPKDLNSVKELQIVVKSEVV